MADNTVHYQKGKAWLEVYADTPNAKAAERVEKCFKRNKIPYDYMGEEYIKSEKMYMTIFNFEYVEG